MSDKKALAEKNADIANKLVEKYGTHEKVEIEDTSKKYELDENMDTDDFKFDKTETHIFRFLEFGYALVGANKSKSVARQEIVDIITNDIIDGNLVLGDAIIAEL